MTTKKYDVEVTNTIEGWGYSSTERLECGKMSATQIKKYLKEISEYSNIPDDSCIHHIYAMYCAKDSMSTTLCRNCTQQSGTNESNYGSLQLHVFLTNGKKCNRHDCFNNIQNGKCTDKFVIDIIGKKFFSKQYKDTKQR